MYVEWRSIRDNMSNNPLLGDFYQNIRWRWHTSELSGPGMLLLRSAASAIHTYIVQSPPSTAGRTKLDPGTSCTGAGTVQWQLQVDSPRVQEEFVARKTRRTVLQDGFPQQHCSRYTVATDLQPRCRTVRVLDSPQTVVKILVQLSHFLQISSTISPTSSRA